MHFWSGIDIEALDKHRGKGKQKITVEYVNVEAGGQAIVGNVATSAKTGSAKKSSTRETVPALENNSDPVMPTVGVAKTSKMKAPEKVQSKRGK